MYATKEISNKGNPYTRTQVPPWVAPSKILVDLQVGFYVKRENRSFSTPWLLKTEHELKSVSKTAKYRNGTSSAKN